MKLKNSYVLLAVMAIFLLVSIGSVCASENITTDSDVALTSDGSSVVLADDSSEAATTEKIDTSIVSENAKYRDNESAIIPVTVKDNTSASIDVTKDNLTVNEGNKTIKFNYNNSQITITDKLAKGNHSLIIKYLGNNIYKNSTTNIVLSIFGNSTIESASTINVNQSKIIEIPLTISDGVNVKEASSESFSAKITYKDGNSTKTLNVSELKYNNGKLIADATLVDNIKSYNMTIYYNESGYTTSKTVTLKIVRAIKITPLNTEVNYQDGNFTFKVTDAITGDPIANKTIAISGNYNSSQVYWDIKQSGNSISLSSSKALTTDANGIATLKNINFYPGLLYTSGEIYATAGTYNVTLSGSGDLSGELKTTIKINKINAELSIAPLNEYYGTTEKVTITVVNSDTKKPVSGVAIFFNMTNSQGKEITFTTTGSNNTVVKVNYAITDSNGTVQLPVNNLLSGKYSVYGLLNSSSNYNKSEATQTATIKQIPVTYSISSTGVITVTNTLTKKPQSGVYVIVTFDGNKNKRFLSQTNKNGQIIFTTVGKHKITVSDAVNGDDADTRYTGATVSKTITNKKITAKASAPKVTTYYKTDKYFTVKLTNSAKKAIYDAKLTIKVYVPSNKYYYTYKGTTDLDGKVRIQINGLKPGTYKVVVTSGDTKSFSLKKVTSKIVVKKAPTTLTPKKLTAKKGKSTYFKVTVKNTKTKKIIKGVKVKIKVYTGKKYKTYTVKTNSKGIAQLNVKSLKVGTHKVVVSSANKYCVAKAKKSTIKITKK